jgi:hypothetical protein
LPLPPIQAARPSRRLAVNPQLGCRTLVEFPRLTKFSRGTAFFSDARNWHLQLSTPNFRLVSKNTFSLQKNTLNSPFHFSLPCVLRSIPHRLAPVLQIKVQLITDKFSAISDTNLRFPDDYNKNALNHPTSKLQITLQTPLFSGSIPSLATRPRRKPSSSELPVRNHSCKFTARGFQSARLSSRLSHASPTISAT